ncbi:hypothetical protein AMELA_G00032380 [Ameiurus melas]|uniref:Uncharacterized protein n=1 Tax=Ameiurus melas TaxID=219545 RepID=A0A7J6B7F4_AMEME|nr:hypothetical protein AMELA_G00032380 [Ameiurus melas]
MKEFQWSRPSRNVCHFRVTGNLEPILGSIGHKAGFHLKAYETRPYLQVKEAPQATAACVLKTEGCDRISYLDTSRTSRPTENSNTTSLPAESIEEKPEEIHTLEESRGKSYSSVLRSTPRKMSNTWIIKEKLEQIKAEMQRISERHALTRPERKAYHPFVWNSLSPYRDTTEIDYLIVMASVHRTRNRRASVRTVHLSH